MVVIVPSSTFHINSKGLRVNFLLPGKIEFESNTPVVVKPRLTGHDLNGNVYFFYDAPDDPSAPSSIYATSEAL
jgi:hypothetical protein